MAKKQKTSNKKSKKQRYATEETFQSLEEFAHKTENFFEKHAKEFAIGFGVLIVGALAYFAYLQYVQKPKNAEAYNELVEVQKNFVTDSLDKVLGNEVSGAAYLANEKSGLKAGKLAGVYAGNAEFKKGNYQKALEYFKKYSSKDDIANAAVKRAIGDCYVELNDNENAMQQFKSSYKETNNGGSKLLALKKIVALAIEAKEEAQAVELLKDFEENFPDTDKTGFVASYLLRLDTNKNGK